MWYVYVKECHLTFCSAVYGSKDAGAFLPTDSIICCRNANTMDSSHQRAIRRALKTAASHQYKLKKTSSLSARQFLCFHVFSLNAVWKKVFFSKPLLSPFGSKMCFYLHLTPHRRSTRLIPECERLPDIATKRRQHIIIAIWNVTTVLHAWGSGFWHIVTLGHCFQLKTSLSSQTGNKIHCPVCRMTVFIVNGFFVTEKSAGTLRLRDVVHLSCSRSHFIRSARTTPMTRSLWPEAQRVLFITIKSACPNVSASSLAGMAATPGQIIILHSDAAI